MPHGAVEPRWHCPQTCMHTTEHRPTTSPTTGRRRNQAATKRSSIVVVLAGLSDPPSTAALVVIIQRLLRHSLLDLGSSGHLHWSSLECQREKHAHVRAHTDHILSCTACLLPPQHITMQHDSAIAWSGRPLTFIRRLPHSTDRSSPVSRLHAHAREHRSTTMSPTVRQACCRPSRCDMC